MFSPVYVCFYVCVLTGFLETTDQIVIKFYGVVGHNRGTNQLDLNDYYTVCLNTADHRRPQINRRSPQISK